MQSESPAQYVVDLARAVLGRGRLLATMGAAAFSTSSTHHREDMMNMAVYHIYLSLSFKIKCDE